ncbi:MAG TPA: hypothetical protein VLE21_03950 [Candidatus Nitrosocosmicus sp.]|nr:hypothetical protein [Candidatus Nitrosocosmicus sp.]
MYKTQNEEKILDSNNILVFAVLILLLTFGATPSYSQNFEEDQSSMVQITKSTSNTYTLVNDTAFIKPFFDTTYIISGNSSSINNSQNIINSTIINDFMSSPTSGYIIQSINTTNMNGNLSTALPSLPNPFADVDSISKSIQQQLNASINNAIELDYYDVDIKCIFGENIQDWKCQVFSLPE